VKIKIWNRTIEKAQALAAEFGGEAIRNLENILLSDHDNYPATVLILIGTIPAPAQDELPLLEMYDKARNYSLGIVVDMAYRPRQTSLLLAANSNTIEWIRVEGIEVLLEQGFEQFEMWTRIKSPQAIIRDRVYAQYE
jgi:pentafunctional AROM polypeptide